MIKLLKWYRLGLREPVPITTEEKIKNPDKGLFKIFGMESLKCS